MITEKAVQAVKDEERKILFKCRGDRIEANLTALGCVTRVCQVCQTRHHETETVWCEECGNALCPACWGKCSCEKGGQINGG